MSAHKFWRVIDFDLEWSGSLLTNPSGGRLSFVTAEGVLSNDPLRALSSGSTFAGSTPASNAFNWGNSSNPRYSIGVVGGGNAWIGYEFETPVTVVDVKIFFYSSYPVTASGSQWVNATVEYSDDGVLWFFYRFLFNGTRSTAQFPHNTWRSGTLSATSLAERTLAGEGAHASITQNSMRVSTPIVFESLRIGEVYSQDYNVWEDPEGLEEALYSAQLGRGREGYIGGVVYERVGLTAVKKPVKRQVFLIDQATNLLVLRMWSNTEGKFMFKNLDPNREFILYSIDHTKQWGLEGAAYRKPKLRIYDGVSIQYPTE